MGVILYLLADLYFLICFLKYSFIKKVQSVRFRTIQVISLICLHIHKNSVLVYLTNLVGHLLWVRPSRNTTGSTTRGFLCRRRALPAASRPSSHTLKFLQWLIENSCSHWPALPQGLCTCPLASWGTLLTCCPLGRPSVTPCAQVPLHPPTVYTYEYFTHTENSVQCPSHGL